jgi:hypothetical protein
VKRQPQVVVYSNYDALADSTQFADRTALYARKRRLRGSQQKGARQPYPLKWLTDYARFERANIGGNIRQFWHGYQLARRGQTFATSMLAAGIYSDRLAGACKSFASSFRHRSKLALALSAGRFGRTK